MGYKLCMAEKPSVAADIAKVIGATQKNKDTMREMVIWLHGQ